jgi:hypothetical protein
MSKQTLFHGSYKEITRPEIRIGRHTKDFGNGFYCTVIREQAVRWAKRFDTPVVNTYTALINDNLKVLNFEEMTDEWLDFIAACRLGIGHDYDIVIGAMADDQIYNYVQDYIDGSLTREQFWVLAKFRYPTHQIAFCSKRALDCLTFEHSEEV